MTAIMVVRILVGRNQKNVATPCDLTEIKKKSFVVGHVHLVMYAIIPFYSSLPASAKTLICTYPYVPTVPMAGRSVQPPPPP